MPQIDVVLSLAVTAVGNTAANRRLTFRIRGRAGLLRALGVLHGLDVAPARPAELTVLIVASLVATMTGYVALRSWVFARHGRPGAAVASTG